MIIISNISNITVLSRVEISKTDQISIFEIRVSNINSSIYDADMNSVSIVTLIL